MKMSSTTMPAVQSWLGQELETRGIDAVIYTRYILSILQQDGFEPEFDFDLLEPYSLRKQRNLAKFKGKSKKKRGLRRLSVEDRKKSAVLECLQSVAEEECGIEGLVEELCLKLKKVQEERAETRDDVFMEQKTETLSDDNSKKSENQAERYYEAFPALNGSQNASSLGMKPIGAWSSRRTRSGDLSVDGGTPQSKSASVSRSSTSPTGFLEKKKRARSLPNSLMPSRKNSFNEGRKGKGRDRKGRNTSREWGQRLDDRSKERRVKDLQRNPRKVVINKKPLFVERKFLNLQRFFPLDPVHWKPSEKQIVCAKQFCPVEVGAWDPPTEEDMWEEALSREESNDEELLEEAVNLMAESICREIVDEYETENTNGECGHHQPRTMPRGDDDCIIISSSGWFDDPKATSADNLVCGIEVMAPRLEVSPGMVYSCQMPAVWERDLVPGSPTLPEKGPWMELARSCQQATPNLLSPQTPGNNGSTSEDHSENTSVSEELSVVIDDEPVVQEPPKNAPIGTGRGSESLLRICNHDHSLHLSSSSQEEGLKTTPEPSSQSGEWPSMEDKSLSGDLDDISSGPPSDNIWSGFTTENPDSLAEGIRSSCGSGHTSITSNTPTGYTIDMNNVLWSTYDNEPFRVNPPKVVTWNETVLSPFITSVKRGNNFIEGGVYGSPYGSNNNSLFNSCSTSPRNESSMRELWDNKEHMQELTAAACKLEEYFSPRPTPNPDLCLDEQSIIEDSLAESPKFLSSRSSSRFDFARDPFADQDASGGSSPAETDDMVSETEFCDEILRKNKYVCDNSLSINSKCNNSQQFLGNDLKPNIPMQEGTNTDSKSSTNLVNPSPLSSNLSGENSLDSSEVKNTEDKLGQISLEPSILEESKKPPNSPVRALVDITITPIEDEKSKAQKMDKSSTKRTLWFDCPVSLDQTLRSNAKPLWRASLSEENVQFQPSPYFDRHLMEQSEEIQGESQKSNSPSFNRGSFSQWNAGATSEALNFPDEMYHFESFRSGSKLEFSVEPSSINDGSNDSSRFVSRAVIPKVGESNDFERYRKDRGSRNWKKGAGVDWDSANPLSNYKPEVITDLDQQLFPFEEEVFLKEEGLLAEEGSIDEYNETCHCDEDCRSSCIHKRRLSRGSSVDDSEWEQSRLNSSTRMDKGQYSSRPPERVEAAKHPRSQPIRISKTR